MGMYTEFIFGCALREDTPRICIEALDYVINGEEKKPRYENPITCEEKLYNDTFIDRILSVEEIENFADFYDLSRLCYSFSGYFGAGENDPCFYYDSVIKAYRISIRSDIKNYENQIDRFLEYIEPYIKSGSGSNDIYAYVLYEENEYPYIYSLKGGKTKFKGKEYDD